MVLGPAKRTKAAMAVPILRCITTLLIILRTLFEEQRVDATGGTTRLKMFLGKIGTSEFRLRNCAKPPQVLALWHSDESAVSTLVFAPDIPTAYRARA
jgi:hypothetical protein